MLVNSDVGGVTVLIDNDDRWIVVGLASVVCRAEDSHGTIVIHADPRVRIYPISMN